MNVKELMKLNCGVSVTQNAMQNCFRWSNLLLKELSRAFTVSCMGWESFSIMDDSLAIILLPPTTCTEPRGHPRTELAFLISLSSLFLSAVEMLLPSRPLLKKWLMPPQCHRRSSGVPPALQKTSVSWADRVCSEREQRLMWAAAEGLERKQKT